jgi:hypothetical protein
VGWEEMDGGVRVLMGWELSMEVTGGEVMKDTPRSPGLTHGVALVFLSLF